MRGGNRGGRGGLRSFPMMPSGMGNSRGGVLSVGRGMPHNGVGRGAPFAMGGGRGGGGGGGRSGRGANGVIPNVNINNNVHAQNGCSNGARRSVDGVGSKDSISLRKQGEEDESAETENRWYNDVAL